jgi:hypothetical protein
VGGVLKYVIAPPTDAEAREEQYKANGPYTYPLTVINVPKLHTL